MGHDRRFGVIGIDASDHADVLVLRPGDTGSIKIDPVREAIDRTTYRPFEGRRRVVIVDEADAMVAEAQNALLKTLEEPRPASMFVLITSRPDMLLPTVRSRCQQLRFGRLSAADVASVLMRSHGYSSADAHAVASVADGSLSQALEGGSESFVHAREAAAEMLRGVSGSGDPHRRRGSAKAFAGGGDREAVARQLRALASMLRDLAALGYQADEQYLENVDLAPVLRRLAGSFDAGVCGGRSGAGRDRSKREPENRVGLAGVPVVRPASSFQLPASSWEPKLKAKHKTVS